MLHLLLHGGLLVPLLLLLWLQEVQGRGLSAKGCPGLAAAAHLTAAAAQDGCSHQHTLY
jgi:hypothetical protein